MRWLVMAVVLSAGVVLGVGQVEAQYRYTDDKGATKVKQYKLDIPESYRDSAEWIGPTGVGKPGLSEEQRQRTQRWDAYRRIGEANEKLRPYQKADEDAKKAAAAAAAVQREREAERRQEAADAAQSRRDALAEESVRLQRESVDLERARQYRPR